ncbi:hypothetical protein N483_16780 [Pseudoalteromonas luteoviolacea NCIMB 1944]|nr:hypothetical protein N483_16780 [Pseudoalteromonas luteoviolacea NCIMB 1944]
MWVSFGVLTFVILTEVRGHFAEVLGSAAILIKGVRVIDSLEYKSSRFNFDTKLIRQLPIVKPFAQTHLAAGTMSCYSQNK